MTSRVWLRPVLRTALGAALLALLIAGVGAGELLDRLRAVEAGTVLAALALGAVGTACTAWRWVVVARALGLRLGWGEAVGDCYRASFLNSVLPAGVLGDVHRAVGHGRRVGRVGAGVRAVLLERLAGQLVLVAVAVAVLAARPGLLHAVGEVVPGGLLWLLLLLLGIPAVVVAGRLLRARLPGVLAEVRALARGRRVVAVLLASALGLGSYLVMFVLAARAAGVTAGTAELLPLLVLAMMAMTLPLSVGGWGPREAAATAGFAAVGLGAAEGLAAAVVYGLLGLVATAPGALVLLRGRRSAGPGDRASRRTVAPPPQVKVVSRLPIHSHGRP